MKLSEKIKEQESAFEAKLDSHILIRLDGKNFSKWTRGFEKPYDERITRSMKNTTRALMEETGAQTGYTQSDEITLFLKAKEGSQHFLGGRMQKLCSLTAAYATSYFQKFMEEEWMRGVGLPVFDSRVWAVEDFRNILDAFIWREKDCIKNSVSSLAQIYFSPRELHKKHTGDKIQMLKDNGVYWKTFPREFRFGTYFIKTKIKKSFSEKELDRLPPKHEAHDNPDLEIERNEIIEVSIAGNTSIKNYQSFIYEGKL